MKLSLRNIRPWRTAIRLTSCAFVFSAFAAVSAGAQEAPYAEFQYATITGTNNVINVTMLPVVSESGAIVYENMTLQFEVSFSGAITLAPGSPTLVAAPTPQISSFEAGTYDGPSSVEGGNAVISVFGPGVTIGGATEWSIAAVSTGGSGCAYPPSATFYVGPITSNPLYSRLNKAGITSTAYSYGIIGSNACVPNGYWYSGGLIGLSQTNGALTIVSFSDGADTDYSTPKDQITYTLKH